MKQGAKCMYIQIWQNWETLQILVMLTSIHMKNKCNTIKVIVFQYSINWEEGNNNYTPYWLKYSNIDWNLYIWKKKINIVLSWYWYPDIQILCYHDYVNTLLQLSNIKEFKYWLSILNISSPMCTQDNAIEHYVNLKTGKMPILEYKLEYLHIDTNCIINVPNYQRKKIIHY